MDALVDRNIDRIVRVVDIPRVENRSNRFDILDPQGVGEDAPEIPDSRGRGLKSGGIVKSG